MTTRFRNHLSVRTSRILAAIAICVAATAVLAQEPMPKPLIPRPPIPRNATAEKLARLEAAGIHVFHAGALRHPQRRAFAVPQGAYLPGLKFRTALNQNGPSPSPPFTLTPQQPYLANQGMLEVIDEPYFSTYEKVILLGQGGQIEVLVNVTAGQTYLIDAGVVTESPNAGCHYTVSGPSGQQTTYPCDVYWNLQHLLFAYPADVSGLVTFSITFTNQTGNGDFLSATVSAT